MPGSCGWRKGDAMSDNGFSLIELVVIIAILSVISGLMAPLIFTQIDASKAERTREVLERLETALLNHLRGCDLFPNDTGNDALNLRQLMVNHEGLACWAGPYIMGRFSANDYTIDAWGRALRYNVLGAISTVCNLSSPGPDGTPGTQDDITLTVDGTQILTQGRYDEAIAGIRTINTAITAFNRTAPPYLSHTWEDALDSLSISGFLPDEERYLFDPWSAMYATNPDDPVVRVYSFGADGIDDGEGGDDVSE